MSSYPSIALTVSSTLALIPSPSLANPSCLGRSSLPHLIRSSPPLVKTWGMASTRRFSHGQAKVGRLRLFYQQYGKPGLIVYLTISTLDLLLAWGTVEFLGVDMHSITQRVSEFIPDIKEYFGFSHASAGTEVVDDAKAEGQGYGITASTPSWMKSFLIGYAFHKILVPIRVPLTAAITPSFARWAYRTGVLKMPKGMPAPKKGDTRKAINQAVSKYKQRVDPKK